MRPLVLTPKFKRSFRKFVVRNPKLKNQIQETLQQMQEDIFEARLCTHKLKGDLSGLKACSCGYDCRIIFSIQTQKETKQEVILLLDIGTHDKVY